MSTNDDTNTRVIKNIMTLVDDHSDELPEGDYLEICNKLKDMFVNRNNTRRPRTLPRSLQLNPMDRIFERCMVLVRERKQLKRSLKEVKIRKRVTVRLKREALDSYCNAMDLPYCETLQDLQDLGHAHDSNDFFKDYMNLINGYLRGLRERYIVECDNIENEMLTYSHFICSTQRIINAFNDIELDIPPIQ
jgi:hypothetical protein|tara:strand:+ start:3570 stop:4142 length:573 start_codon:yes stop_codon:yes gene_type:complete